MLTSPDFPHSYKTKPSARGFTVIELLVTISIFIVVTSVVLGSYPRFSSRIVLENVAHHVALTIRQAQTYGLSVKGFGTGANAVFPGYGVYFYSPGIGSKSYILFGDTDGDGHYDLTPCGGSGSECLETFTIQSVDSIYLLCGDLKAEGTTWQSPGAADCSLSSLHVTFTRPDPDATIIGYSETQGREVQFSDAEIVVRSPKGDARMGVVYSTGQISVE